MEIVECLICVLGDLFQSPSSVIVLHKKQCVRGHVLEVKC